MTDLTLDAYQAAAGRLAGEDGYDRATLLAIYGLGVAEEAGEVAGIIKRAFRDAPAWNETEAALLDELGDVLWYVAALARLYDLPLSTVAEQNRRKLAARHPDGFRRVGGGRVGT